MRAIPSCDHAHDRFPRARNSLESNSPSARAKSDTGDNNLPRDDILILAVQALKTNSAMKIMTYLSNDNPISMLRGKTSLRIRPRFVRVIRCSLILTGATLLLVPPCLAQSGWRPIASMGEVRYFHAATLLSNGNVLVEGGYLTGSAEIYNPVKGSWRPTGSVNILSREQHTSTLLPDGRVLVAGGYVVPDSIASAELYDPMTGTWSLTGSLNEARMAHGAALLADGKVLVAGGSGAGSLASAELYDPVTGTWSLTGSMTDGRDLHTTTRLADGRVLVAGGEKGFGSTYLTSAEIYDPATGIWTPTGSLHFKRRQHTATLLSDGKVLVAGGYTPGATASCEVYDPATGIWTLTGSLITGRFSHKAVLQHDGTVLVAGGDASDLKSTELYDPVTGTWSAAGNLKTQRSAHTITLLADGTTLVTGGIEWPAIGLNSAEIYTPAFAEPMSVDGNGTFNSLRRDRQLYYRRYGNPRHSQRHSHL